MSGTKRMLEKVDQNKDLAKRILNELGVIEICNICGYYTAKKDLTDEIYSIATNKYKEIINDEGDFKLFHDCLQSIYNEAGIESIKVHIDKVH